MSRTPASVVPFPDGLLPTGDTLPPDEDTAERPTYVTRADFDAAIHRVEAALAGILAHVGPEAQRHRARREAALLASVVVGVGCLGLGALDLQGASDATIVILGGLVLAAVLVVAAVMGRVQVHAKAPGVEVNAGGSTGGSA